MPIGDDTRYLLEAITEFNDGRAVERLVFAKATSGVSEIILVDL